MIMFKHCIDLHKGVLKEDEDYDFWAVIFENDAGETINRNDADEAQIKGYLSTKDDFVKIWREFQVEEKPTRWIVWPHSKTNGWLEKLEGQL